MPYSEAIFTAELFLDAQYISLSAYTLCLKKTTLKIDTDVTHYRFNPHQPI